METVWTATRISCGISQANVSAVNRALGTDGVETFRWYDCKRLTETIKDIRRLQGDDELMSIEVERNLHALCVWIEHQTATEQAIDLAEFDSNTKNVWLDHVDFTDRITDELAGYCERMVLPELEVPSQWRSQGRPIYHNAMFRFAVCSVIPCNTQSSDNIPRAPTTAKTVSPTMSMSASRVPNLSIQDGAAGSVRRSRDFYGVRCTVGGGNVQGQG
jgi:hypothetical protein